MNPIKSILDNIIESCHTLTNIRVIDRRSLYKMWEVEQLRRMLSYYSVDCVFDIGANKGQYAEMLRKSVGFKGLIISFEPIPEAAAEVRRKARNDSNWIVQEQAVAAHDGEQTFNIMNNSQFSSLSEPRHDEVDIFQNQNKSSRTIKVITEKLGTAYHRLLEEYEFKRPFLKMDTQGYDMEIVVNGRDVLDNFIGLQSELAIKKIYESAVDYRQVISYYEECGFTLSAFLPNNAGHFPLLVETDCLMTNNRLLK
jgi:FkbM family methyltransferase